MPKTKKSSNKKTAPQKKVFNKINISKIKIPDNLKPFAKILGMIILIVGSLTVIDLAVQYLNNDYSVAVVDGTRISKAKWHDRLEKAYGSTVATQLIQDQIIKTEAGIAEVSVTEEEIDTEIDNIIESIGGEEMFDSALLANNITLEELRDQIEIDLLSTKILTPTLEYGEESVKEFFNQYSDVIFPEETSALEEGEKLDFEKYKEETEEIYIQQQVQTELTTWLNNKMTEYKIQDNSTGKPKYGFLTITTNIVNNLLEKVKDSE